MSTSLKPNKVVPNPTFLLGYEAFKRSKDRDADAFVVAMNLTDAQVQYIELFPEGWHHWVRGFEMAQDKAHKSLINAIRTKLGL